VRSAIDEANPSRFTILNQRQRRWQAPGVTVIGPWYKAAALFARYPVIPADAMPR
jgi:hypothetical protein